MDTIFSEDFLIIALFLEQVVQALKQIEIKGSNWFTSNAFLVSIVLAVSAAFAFGLDITPDLGLPTLAVPWAGKLITGVILSLGSNFIHGVRNKIEA